MKLKDEYSSCATSANDIKKETNKLEPLDSVKTITRTSECIWKAYRDSRKIEGAKGGANGGASGGRAEGPRTRKHFHQDLVHAVQERDLVWKTAKQVLGHNHAIFNKFDKKGRLKPRSPDDAPMKEIKALTDVLSLPTWTTQKTCANRVHLTDEQRGQGVDARANLHAKLTTWGVAEHRALTKGRIH
jgi:hypothetical protein